MEKDQGEGFTYRQWRAADPRRIFLLVHGLGAHAGRWEAMAGFFLKKGISSYAPELRSNNPSVSPAAEDRFVNFRSKILAVQDIAAKENPAKKIFLIGESLGAIISFLICVEYPSLFSGLVCISPAFTTKHKMTVFECSRMLVPLLYNPDKQFALPFDSSMCTRDPYYRDILDKDTREYRSISSRFIFEIFMIQARALAQKNKMLTPTLFLAAEDDKIADPAAASVVFDSLKVVDRKFVGFPGMYHSLSIESGREKVFEEILGWVEERL